jgi:ferric-dicitrate binding protein FerR (iron transport regulator)
MENLNKHKDTFLAKWLAGELTNEQLKSMVSEEDYRAYIKLRRGLDVAEQLDLPVDESFNKIKQRIQPKKGRVIPLGVKWTIGIAASFLILFSVFNFFKSNQVLIETNFGEHKSITLKDGSEVILNSKSSLSYNEDNWDEDRSIQLNGEAYFKVAKGKTFTVNTKNGSVEVLGTQFNVNSFEDFFDVTCFEGKVRVTTNDNEKHVLTPNEGVRKINGDATLSLSTKTAQPSWISGESTFESVPLYYVIQALENEYKVKFDSTGVNTNILYSGGFPNDNLDIALQSVFNALDIDYQYTDKTNIKLSNSK